MIATLATFLHLYNDRSVLLIYFVAVFECEVPVEFLAEVLFELFQPLSEPRWNSLVVLGCEEELGQKVNQKVVARHNVHEEIVGHLSDLK